MSTVEKSITDSSTTPVDTASNPDQTAYAISVQQQQANTILGPFLTMIGSYVLQYGKLRIGDIIQNLTVPELLEIEGQPELVYKSFILRDSTGNHKKVEFDYKMPDKMTKEEKLKRSYGVLKKQGGIKGKQTLWVANPSLFRKLKYEESISADVLNPLSEDLERQFGLAQWDRMVSQVQTGMYDAEETGKLLLEIFPRTKKNPDKFLGKQPQGQAQGQGTPPQGSPPKPMNPTGTSPIAIQKQPVSMSGGMNLS